MYDTVCIGFNQVKQSKLPVYGDVLIIPNKIDDEGVIEWHRLKEHSNCGCFNIYKRIRKVVIKSSYIQIKGVFKDFINLEEIELHGKADIQHSGIENCKNFKRITFGKGCMIKDFKELKPIKHSIKEIRFIGSRSIYLDELFKDYKSLEPSWVLHEGLIYIGRKAFGDCKNFVDVNLPKSLRCMNITAFKGCNNIKNFRINSLVNLEGTSYLHYRDDDKEFLLENSSDATVYCPLDYPINFLKKHLNPRVKIVEDGIINPGVSRRTLMEKVKILGIKGVRDIPETVDLLIQSLELMDEEAWKRQVIREVVNVVELDYYQSERIVGDGAFFVKIKVKKPEYEHMTYRELILYNLKGEFREAIIKGERVRLIFESVSREGEEKSNIRGFELELLLDKKAILRELKGKSQYWISTLFWVNNCVEERLLEITPHLRLIYN